jgi:multiple sugar transport system permease protein
MAEEGFAIDLSPIWSGKGARFVGGIPFYSGGIYPTAVHYLDALSLGHFPRLVLNSTLIALLGVALSLVIGVPAAYALARLRMRGKGVVAFLLLGLRTISPFALVLPLFLLFVRNGLWDTYVGVAAAYLVVLLSVVVWMIRGFFADIPRETYEAADLFGATERQIFWRVALPMILPGIAVTAVFGLVLVWNEFLIADVLTGPVTRTVSVGVWAGLGETAFRILEWDDLNAGGTLAFIPVIALFLLIKKYLAKGFSLATAH